ncbi:MAG: sugar phosphate isomerase/epimerase family protein [Desulfobacteraceae bacterium]|jgi:sugar phosphate isomerase/epimerase
MTDSNIHLGGTARSAEDVKRLHNLGLQFAEIPITNPQEFSKLIKTYKDLRDRLEIYYLCHGPREGDPNDVRGLEEVYLPKIFETLPLMDELGMALLTLHLWFDSRFVKEEVISFKIGLLRHIIKKAAEFEITVCVENLSETASHMVAPFTDLPLLNLTLDVGHAQLLAETNTSYGFIERYPKRIRHVHLHDNRGGDSYRDDLHLLPGEGIVDFEKVFGKLMEIGYDRTITLELIPSEIEKCLGRVKEWLRRSGLE